MFRMSPYVWIDGEKVSLITMLLVDFPLKRILEKESIGVFPLLVLKVQFDAISETSGLEEEINWRKFCTHPQALHTAGYTQNRLFSLHYSMSI